MPSFIEQLFEVATPLFPEADQAEVQTLPSGTQRLRFYSGRQKTTHHDPPSVFSPCS